MPKEPIPIDFTDMVKFQPKQLEFLEAIKKHTYTLGGGAAGGGKSFSLRWIAVYLCLYYYAKYKKKGIKVGIFCEDYPAIKDRHLSRIPYEFPKWLGTLNKTEHDFVLAPDYGGGIITFRNLDDPSKYLSSEWAAILVDELTKNPREVFDFLNMRLRWPGISDTKFIAATNPGGKGHAFTKKLWVDRDFSDETFDPSEFAFVPFKYSDNSHLDGSYEKKLQALPEQLRKAYKDGSWDIFAGQFFSEFRKELHVCKPFEIPKEWPRLIGVDYGYTAYSAVLWMAYDPAFRTFYVYKEIYVKEKTYKELAQMIAEQNDGATLVVADPAIWAKKDSPNSGSMDMESVLNPNSIRLEKANNDRIVGWGRIRELMKTYKIEGQERSYLRIFDTCPNLIRTIPQMIFEDGTEDLESKGTEDHLPDVLRYIVQHFRHFIVQDKSVTVPLGNSTQYFSSKSDFENEFEEKSNSLFTFN